MTLKYKEYNLQCAVAEYLDGLANNGILAWSHPPNEGKHKPQYRSKQAAAGMKAGEPDCIIYLKGGKTVFIELKVPPNGVKTNQKARHEVLRALGYGVYVVKAKTPQEAVGQVARILREDYGVVEAV